jgi:hypothetical protein
MKEHCIDDEVLADYLEGRLPETERFDIEGHLSDCDQCLELFMTTKSCIRGADLSELEAVPDRVTQAAVRLVTGGKLSLYASLKEKILQWLKVLAERISDYLNLAWGKRHLAPVRGYRKMTSEGRFLLRKTFKEIDTKIEIERTSAHKTLIRVKLPGEAEQSTGVRVTLKRGEREISSSLLVGGETFFEDIPYGHYSLMFLRNGKRIGEYPFEVKESINGG